MSEELRQCPFCGSKDVMITDLWNTQVLIECLDCGAKGPVGEDDDEATELWNRRVE